jgi:hypothetical protein
MAADKRLARSHHDAPIGKCMTMIELTSMPGKSRKSSRIRGVKNSRICVNAVRTAVMHSRQAVDGDGPPFGLIIRKGQGQQIGPQHYLIALHGPGARVPDGAQTALTVTIAV